MENAETIKNFLNSSWLYLVIILVFVIALLIVSFSNKKKKIRKKIESFQIKINNLKSHPFVVEIAKADGLAKVNEQVKQTSAKCKEDYDQLQALISSIISLIQDGYELLSVSSYKKASDVVRQIEPMMQQANDITNRLKDTLAAILSANSLQRSKINELKAQFHDIKSVVNENPDNYTFCWESLDLITNGISHQFSDFEAIMDSARFDQAAIISEEIKASINKLNTVVSNLPEMISVSKNYIPQCISQLQNKVELSKQENIYLDHLNVNGVIDEMSQKVAEILFRLKNCNIDNVEDDLVEVQTVINQLSVSIDEERNAFSQLDSTRNKCQEKLKEIYCSIDSNDPKSFSHYQMNNTQNDFNNLKQKYQKSINDFNTLETTYQKNDIPASVLLNSYSEILKEIDESLNLKNSISKAIGTNETDEIRARELLARFSIVLNESKAAINTSNLPSISTKYDADIIDAESYITRLQDLLSNKVLNMNQINDIIQKAQDLIISLYKNVNNIIDAANDIENYIVLCNKYRPFYPEVDSILYTAELAYRNGEYTKACKTIATALSQIDPSLSKKLNDSLTSRIGSKEV